MRILAACFAVLILAAPSTGLTFKRTSVGDEIKDFTLTSVEGQELQLSKSLGGGATLVLFWAAWSSRSGEALEDFQALYQEHGPEALQVIGVNVEHQEWDPAEAKKIEAFLQARGVSFPVVFDKDLSVFNQYGVVAVPSTLLVDGKGTIVEILEGYANTTRPEFRERVLRELGALPPEPEEPVVVEKLCPEGVAARYYEMGHRFLDKKMGHKAIQMLQKAAESDPQCGRTFELLARAYEFEEMPEEAAEARKQAQTLGGGEAAPDAQAAAGEAPKRAEAACIEESVRFARMGSLLLKKNMVEQALQMLERSTQEDPNCGSNYALLAEAYDQQKMVEKAAEARRKAAQLGPGKEQP